MFERVYKVCLLGDFAVGKTSLVRRFVYNEFHANYQATIGVHISQKQVVLDAGQEMPVRLIIWDLMGGAPFSAINRAYYRGAAGALLVADVTRPRTTKILSECWTSFRAVNPEAQGIVLLNKVDLVTPSHRIVRQATEMSSTLGLKTFLTSALTGENVEQAFLALGAEILLQGFSSSPSDRVGALGEHVRREDA